MSGTNVGKREAIPSGVGQFKLYLREMTSAVHAANKTWWHDPATGEPLQRNRGEMIMLMVSELAEAMEGERRGLMDDHLPHRKMAEVELADCIIRILDYAGGFGFDLGAAFEEKMVFNRERADHKPESRLTAHGKKW